MAKSQWPVVMDKLSSSGSRWVQCGLSVPILAILFTAGLGGRGILVILFTKANEVGPQSTKRVGTWYARGSVHGMQGEGFATESGGIMEVAM
jgi:hypothetical protein